MSETPNLTYIINEGPAGVTQGWIYIWQGVGPALAIPAVMLTDGEGGMEVVPAGEPINVTIVDDRPENAKDAPPPNEG